MKQQTNEHSSFIFNDLRLRLTFCSISVVDSAKTVTEDTV